MHFTFNCMIQSWGVMIAITDGVICAYDISTYDLICTVPDSKGCTLFSTQERESLLVTINRKKISFYLWQSNSFEFCGDRSLGDVPRMVRCTLRCVVLGYRRHYEAVDVPPRHSNLTATTPQGHMSLGKYLCLLVQQYIRHVIALHCSVAQYVWWRYPVFLYDLYHDCSLNRYHSDLFDILPLSLSYSVIFGACPLCGYTHTRCRKNRFHVLSRDSRMLPEIK